MKKLKKATKSSPKKPLKIKKHTKRYFKTEHIINIAVPKLLLEHRGKVRIRQLSQMTNLSPQTIYNHRGKVDKVIKNTENALLGAFSLDLENEIKRSFIHDPNKKAFTALFIIMSRKKEIFSSVCKDYNDLGILFLMVEALYPFLTLTWPSFVSLPEKIKKERVDFFLWQIIWIICQWGQQTGCDFNLSEKYVVRLLNLTSGFLRRTSW